MSSLPILDSQPASLAERSASPESSEVSRIASLNTIAQQPANTSQEHVVSAPLSSPTDSSGGVDVVESAVSLRGLYGHIDAIVQGPPGHTSPPSFRRPLPSLATRSMASPTPASPPLPPLPPSPPPAAAAAEDLPGYAAHNPGPYRTLPRNLDLNDPLAGQFIRGIANIRLATTQVDQIDTQHVRLLAREGETYLGGGMPAAREARRALRAAEQELHEAFEAALAAVQQNRTDEEQLRYLGELLRHLEGWITDTEAQTANYSRRIENEVAGLRHANAELHQENEHLGGWIRDTEAQTAGYARRMENAVAYQRQANAQLAQENQTLRVQLQQRDVELQRRAMRIEYLESEVAEYAGYN